VIRFTPATPRSTPTDLKVVPAACPTRWSTEGYRDHSRTTPQASRPALTHVGQVREETRHEAITLTAMSLVSEQIVHGCAHETQRDEVRHRRRRDSA
jgi:hypothetical protein